MVRAAVLGKPISHSLSPVLHRAAYAALGLTDWTYDAIECAETELAGLLDACGPEWAGFSCTMPLKRETVRLAVEVDSLAAAVGAANTLLRLLDGGWRAVSTDVAGIVGALGEHGVRPADVTVLGAGGTAQNVLGALGSLGLSSCSVLVRDRSRAVELQAAAERLGVRVSLAELVPSAPELNAQLVVSTLPAGAADALARPGWRADQVLLDASYDPWPSRLAAEFAACGSTVVSGALMLLHQAGAQVELMTGQPAPIEAMRSALRAARPSAGV